MKTLFVLAALLATSGSAHAYSSIKNSCANVRATVTSKGAVVIRTGNGTYDRYVSHSGYCANGLYARPAWIPTADVRECFVGYTCQNGSDNGSN